jgi:ribonuclease VapC
VSYAEAGAVIDGSKDPIASRRFDELIEEAQIAIEPVTEAQARIARQAYRNFGKTSGHPAKLISEIASPMHWQNPKESRSFSKAETFRGRT